MEHPCSRLQCHQRVWWRLTTPPVREPSGFHPSLQTDMELYENPRDHWENQARNWYPLPEGSRPQDSSKNCPRHTYQGWGLAQYCRPGWVPLMNPVAWVGAGLQNKGFCVFLLVWTLKQEPPAAGFQSASPEAALLWGLRPLLGEVSRCTHSGRWQAISSLYLGRLWKVLPRCSFQT